MKATMTAALILIAVAGLAAAQRKSLYKVFRFSDTVVGVTCLNGEVPFVTDAPRGTTILIVSCEKGE